MQIEIDHGSGFCFGVTTAIKKLKKSWKRAVHSTAWVILCIMVWRWSACMRQG